MVPFLYNVAQKFWFTYQNQISNFTFVFPNRRSGVFFKHYLSTIANQPIFSPRIITIVELLQGLSPYLPADRIAMLFALYKNYKQISRSNETFEEFYYWGEMLLNDFDDVDKYLVDVKQLFRNIYELKEIDDNYSYLTESQITIIRRFWSNFLPIEDNEKKKNFAEIWEVLHEVYIAFRKTLAEQGLAYEGMIFREVVESLSNQDIQQKLPEKLVFIGLNAQSTAEERFLMYVNKLGIADFYWDYDSPLVKDNNNKSSLFISKNKLLFPSKLKLNEETFFESETSLNLIGISSSVGQAKFVYTILNEIASVDPEAITTKMKTAIVLADENLLIPTLFSIPKSIDKINVTMGYNFSNTSIVGFMNYIFDLQQNIRFKKDENEGYFYYKYVLVILNHKYISNIAIEEATRLQQMFVERNMVTLPQSLFAEHKLFSIIFKYVDTWKDFSTYLKDILRFLQTHYLTIFQSEEDIDVDMNAKDYDEIESEFIIEYFKTINRLEDIIEEMNVEVNITIYIKLLKKIVSGISIPFKGEPLSGLQVMGVLETRALDFENLIILSMNEGVFPSQKAANSFIPHSLRKGFELPTYEHQDAIYAYHFYRMISRAKNIYLLYDSRTEGIKSGEVSRYFKQIKHLYPQYFKIDEKLLVYNVTVADVETIAVDKTPAIQDKMKAFLKEGNRKLSASALNTYLDCPLLFYFSVIENLEEVEEVEETIEASMFGTIFHAMMEEIYNRYKGQTITSDVLIALSKNEAYLDDILLKAFAQNFFKQDTVIALEGQNYLIGEIIKKYVIKLLTTDSNLLSFQYINSEEKLDEVYKLDNDLVVNLTGYIDRIDKVENTIRIIDYKTGKGILDFYEMDDLFNKELKDRPKAIMQVFMYAHLYLYKYPNLLVEPHIYYLRNLYSTPPYVSGVQQKRENKNNASIVFNEIRAEFKKYFDACIKEIFDATIPFYQSKTKEACKWCSFTNICKR